MKLKPNKCNFFETEVKFLGHILTPEGALPDPDNVQKIKEWPTSKNVTDIRGILGLGNYYRRFIRNYSKQMQPLINLTKKEAPFKWTETCEEALHDLKCVLTSPEVMAYPTEEGEFILDTDASGETIGAILTQIQQGQERVIAYGS